MLGRSSPSYTVRGYSLPRAGTFAGRPRSLLARAFARNSVLRQMDWLLVVVVSGLSAIGVLLVWSATQPSLAAAGEDPRSYLKKQLLWAVIGLILMFAVSFVDSRRLRSWAPLAYGATLLALLAVLSPLTTTTRRQSICRSTELRAKARASRDRGRPANAPARGRLYPRTV